MAKVWLIAVSALVWLTSAAAPPNAPRLAPPVPRSSPDYKYVPPDDGPFAPIALEDLITAIHQGDGGWLALRANASDAGLAVLVAKGGGWGRRRAPQALWILARPPEKTVHALAQGSLVFARAAPDEITIDQTPVKLLFGCGELANNSVDVAAGKVGSHKVRLAHFTVARFTQDRSDPRLVKLQVPARVFPPQVYAAILSGDVVIIAVFRAGSQQVGQVLAPD